MMRSFVLLLVVALSSSFLLAVERGEFVVVKNDADLKRSGRVVGQVKQGDYLEVRAVRGAWLEVDAKTRGWLRVDNVASQEKALEQIGEQIQRMPRDTNLLLTRARIYLASENFPAADRDLKKVLKLDPSSAEAHYYRGILRLQQEEVQQAIEHFTAAIELRGDDARFYRRRAGLYLLQSDTEQALADYEKLIELRQADASTYNLLAWWYATLDHDHLRNGAKAVEYATRACELTQFKQWAYVDTLAAAYAEANDFTNAVKYQEQAISLGGDDVQEGLKERLEQYRLKRPYREARIDS